MLLFFSHEKDFFFFFFVFTHIFRFFQRGVNQLHVSQFDSEVYFYKEKEKKRKVDVANLNGNPVT